MALQAPDAALGPVPDTPFEIRLSQCDGGIDWSALFGNDRPVEIEIGCGKGSFIIKSAREHTDSNYFGIEKSGKYFRIIARRITSAGLTNIRLVKGEAAHIIKNYCRPASVSACYIFFPDPWPKKRHHKRRLITVSFLKDIHRLLIPGGRIHIATDFTEYFSWITAAAEQCAELKELSRVTIDPSDADAERALTNYERKYLLQGRSIHKAVYEAL